jgi:hypothetical protein
MPKRRYSPKTHGDWVFVSSQDHLRGLRFLTGRKGYLVIAIGRPQGPPLQRLLDFEAPLNNGEEYLSMKRPVKHLARLTGVPF